MWIIMELKADLNLASSRYQQMVSGERMPIPKKNKDAEEVDWKLPGIVVGNDKLPFSDAQGSISRRTLMFEYKRQLLKTKTNLENKLAEELPNLIRKCGRARYFILEWLGDRDIWGEGILPEYFKQTKEKLKSETDPVSRFFNGCCEFATSIEVMEDAMFVTPLEELTNQIKAHGGKDRMKSRSTLDISEDHVKGELAKKGLRMFRIANNTSIDSASKKKNVPRLTKVAIEKNTKEILELQNKTAMSAEAFQLAVEQNAQIEEKVYGGLEVLANAEANDAVISVKMPFLEEKESGENSSSKTNAPLPDSLNTAAQLHAAFNKRSAKDISHNGIEVIVVDRFDVDHVDYAGKIYTSGVFVHGIVITKTFDEALRNIIEHTQVVRYGEKKEEPEITQKRNSKTKENPFVAV